MQKALKKNSPAFSYKPKSKSNKDGVKFCKNCGTPKAEAWDCSCGHKGNRGKFCEECGAAKLVVWDCACGQKGNTGKCCPECGSRRPG